MSKISINYGGGTIILTALLCVLKLTGVLSIPWGWCFCLIWLPFVILFAILGVAVAITVPFLITVFIIEILSNR
jgi:hypothetical protein